MAVPDLPNEILDMICQELSARGDITSLYRCAISSKRFAAQAVQILYRCHSESPANEEESEGFGLSHQAQLVQKWAILWRSIVLSTFGSTMFPYLQYLKTLDLRDLKGLFEDDRFRDRIEKFFFDGEMGQYKKEIKYTFKRTDRGKAVERTRLDVRAIVESMASVIIGQNRGLEEISGEFSAEAFLNWCPQLGCLQRLHIWDGEIFSSEAVRDAIVEHCPGFNNISMHHWGNEKHDEHLASLLMNLPPQVLRGLQTISGRGVGPETCLALSRHNETLTDLHVVFLDQAIPGLALLKDCRAIRNLFLEIPPSVDLEATQKDVYNEMLAWFGTLTCIKSVHLTEFKSAPNLLKPMLLNDKVELHELCVDGMNAPYSVQDHRDFHFALTHQKRLHTLSLRGDGDECFRDDIEALVDSLGQLSNLRKLELHGVADNFSDDATSRLLSTLPLLEEVYIGGLGLSDAVLVTVGSLEKLRMITFAGTTSFTAQGLLYLVDTLRPWQEGFAIAVFLADPGCLIEDPDLADVKRQLWDKARGILDYIPMRDPNLSEFEGESD